MELESPDVEKDFPGLYSLDVSKKGNDSDFSDDSHDKSFKKDLITKRKEKKDKKDKGYAALEGESSLDEDDSKSPSKIKKTRTFKFPVKKTEKREKSREKEGKEKEVEKEKKKKEKDKSKTKDIKKKKHGDDLSEKEDLGVFGVPLQVSVERLGCLDGICLPVPVRQSIECINLYGLTIEGLYKSSTSKNKSVETSKKAYNCREILNSDNLDPTVAAALLINFLKELPEPILTQDLLTRFEEAAAIKEVRDRELELNNLINQLPECNKTVLAWLIVHFDRVTLHEKQNKLNAQSIAIIFSPVLQMSHRLLTAFLCHCKFLFPDTNIYKYVPPLSQGSTFPEDVLGITCELKKQEALLNQIHLGMNEGFVSKHREEQLWEVQRIVTHLKRKLKSFQKTQEIKEESQIENTTDTPAPNKPAILKESKVPIVEESNEESKDAKQSISVTVAELKKTPEDKEIIVSQKMTETQRLNDESDTYKWEKLKLQLEQAELFKLKSLLEDRIEQEKQLADKLKKQIDTYRGFMDSESDESSNDSTPACMSPDTEAKLERLIEENMILTQKKEDLMRQIMEEREACMKLNVRINFIERVYKVN